MNDNPATMYVSEFYEMDPEFEDLLEGTELQNGMIVILSNDGLVTRAPDERRSYESEERYAMKRAELNRFCTVTRLNIVERYDRDDMGRVLGKMSPLVTFIAVYADGIKRRRSYDASFCWIVKKDSIPAEPDPTYDYSPKQVCTTYECTTYVFGNEESCPGCGGLGTNMTPAQTDEFMNIYREVRR